MIRRHSMRHGLLCAAALTLTAAGTLAAGCNGDFVANLTEERTGNITVRFVNNTRFRASFSFATWDSLDRTTPGPISLLQLRLEGNESSAPGTLTCRRNFAIGTDELMQRVIDTNGTQAAGFDADAFSAVVNFSSAAADSDAAALPTAGTAKAREAFLGVDFKCGDELIFTFEEDDTVEGGFRIDFELLPSLEPDA